MTNKELHWHANDLINKSIYSVQLEIEEYKKDLKECDRERRKLSDNVESTQEIFAREKSAIHGLIGARCELEVFEYVQGLLDQAAEEKSTLETVRGYLAEAQKKD